MVKPQIKLSFDGIKEDLKQYLKNQTAFKDYDFEGSNLSVLLDILAYNTYQTNFNVNLSLAEMFLDSAQLKSSVVSHVKQLNYVPRSMVSSRAVVDLFITPTNNPSNIFIPKLTKFTAMCGSDTFTFYNPKPVNIIPINGIYSYKGLEIYEGVQQTEYFAVTENSKYIITNKNVDISSIEVSLLSSVNDQNETVMTRQTSIFGLDPSNNTFFINAALDDNYEITFGKNQFGIEPLIGQVVKISYRITRGSISNNVSNFTTSNISGYPVIVVTNSKSSGGAERESIEDIKYFGPKALQIQNRTVTENDYKILLKQTFPEIADVAVYGGDLANPPQYGKVIVSVAQYDNNRMTVNDVNKYYKFLKSKMPVAIDAVLVSPTFAYVDVVSNVTTVAGSDVDIEQLRYNIINQIIQYGITNLGKFENDFQYSKLVGFIDQIDPEIQSNETTLKLILEYIPSVSSLNSISISFENQLDATNQAFISSFITYNGISGYMKDDGNGNINLINSSSAADPYILRNIGTIDYQTGAVSISQLKIDSFQGSTLKLYATCKAKNINNPVGKILRLRSEDLTVTVTESNG